MPNNFVTDSFHTKKLCSRLSSSEVRFWTEIGRFAFLSSLLGAKGQRTMFILGSMVSAFLLVLIELFSLWCYG